MSIFVLGSREIVAAFALGGMRGKAVEGAHEVLAALDDLFAMAEPVKVLVVEEATANGVRDDIERLKLNPMGPLVVEVSGFAGPAERRKSPLEFVREALGIRI
ncbi:MAG: V-type ATP synthase subunit F [Desulfuromonadales bacterium]|jgi:vacuolar-type H+-ATPase subunit F/Vma7